MIDVNFKNFFFDRAKVQKAVKDAGVGFLSKTLGAVRKTARNSMKAGTTPKGKAKKTRAGKPPLYHTRDLKDKIFFGFDPSEMSGVAGAVRFKANNANILEFGGRATIVDRHSGRVRTVSYQKFPYMAPALEKQLSKIPTDLAGMVKGN